MTKHQRKEMHTLQGSSSIIVTLTSGNLTSKVMVLDNINENLYHSHKRAHKVQWKKTDNGELAAMAAPKN